MKKWIDSDNQSTNVSFPNLWKDSFLLLEYTDTAINFRFRVRVDQFQPISILTADNHILSTKSQIKVSDIEKANWSIPIWIDSFIPYLLIMHFVIWFLVYINLWTRESRRTTRHCRTYIFTAQFFLSKYMWPTKHTFTPNRNW